MDFLHNGHAISESLFKCVLEWPVCTVPHSYPQCVTLNCTVVSQSRLDGCVRVGDAAVGSPTEVVFIPVSQTTVAAFFKHSLPSFA